MNIIRERDAGGNLVAAGYEWGEPNDVWNFLISVIGAAGLFVILLGIVLLKKAFVSAQAIPVGGIIRYGAHWTYPHIFRPRSLIFRDNGKISMPFRVPGYFRPYYELSAHHDQIVSIERVFDDSGDGKGQRHRAAIYFRSGNIVRITNPVHPDDAHMVAVQLTAALQEIRQAAAWRSQSTYSDGQRCA